jgi:RHS repeat-associated protein
MGVTTTPAATGEPTWGPWLASGDWLEREILASGEVPLPAGNRVNDADSMHARFYNPQLGRFLSVDPAAESARPGAPQSWNRYVYVKNNPLYYTDPDGEQALPRGGLERDLDALVRGDIDNQEFLARSQERAKAVGLGLAIGVSLALPGPEDILIAGIAARFGGQLIARGGVLLRSERLAEGATGLTKAERLAINKTRGDAFRDQLAQGLRAEGRQVRPEVTKWTPFGYRRVDLEVSQGGRVLGGIETKTGSSRYTAPQRVKDWWLRNFQGYDVRVVREPPRM